MVEARARGGSLVAVLLVVAAASGCNTQKLAVRAMTPTMNDLMAQVNDEPDTKLVEDGIPSNLLLLDGLASVAPDNDEMAVLASRAFCSYALIFVMDEDPSRAHTLFDQGRGHALRALDDAYPGFRKLADQGTLAKFQSAVDEVDEDDLPALFWAGNCWAGAINSDKGSPAALIALPRVEMIMKRAVKLDESYFFAGPRLFLGIYYAGRPKALGGKPALSKQNFDRAIELTDGKFLLTKVFYAQYYAVQTQDRELFESLLKEVLAAPDDICPGQTLATRVAKQKAKKLLDEEDSFF